MIIDWQADSTEVLLNPKLPEAEKVLFNKLLLDADLKGHIWIATSGTSGKRKYVALSKKAILCSANAVNEHLHATLKDKWLNPLPSFHVGGIGIMARGYFSGATVIDYAQKWNPQSFMEVLQDQQCTLTAMVPTQLFDCVSLQIKPSQSLRAAIIGGGALSPIFYEQATELGWKLMPSYGLTECASQVATAEHPGSDKYKILKHVAVSIDTDGLIHLKSDALLTSYAYITENGLTLADPKVDGWFKTEDRGVIDGNYLTVLGRDSDFLKVGGESVNLASLQKTFDHVKSKLMITTDTALYPVSDDRLGKVVGLCVAGKPSTDIDRLTHAYHQEVLPFEQIKYVRYVDSIPRNELGKVCFGECRVGMKV